MPKKLCWIISNLSYSKQFDQLAQALHRNQNFRLSYILLADSEPIFFHLFKRLGIDVYFVRYRNKWDVPSALLQVLGILRRVKPDIIHAHLLEASFVGLFAARLAGVKVRIYTRHHSNETHLYYPKRAVLYDRLINRLATRIVAVSSAVKDVLVELEGVAPDRVTVIPHGFQLEEMVADKALTETVRRDYRLNGSYPVVGVVSRFIIWKGVQHVIPAFTKLLGKHPTAKLVMANARGNYAGVLRQQLNEQLRDDQYVIIDVERRIFELFKCFDVFVHVPISREVEAYGQVYIEALALEVPAVFTLSGIANGFIQDRRNALVVPYEDPEAIYRAIQAVLADHESRRRMTEQGRKDVWARFHIRDMLSRLDELYGVG